MDNFTNIQRPNQQPIVEQQGAQQVPYKQFFQCTCLRVFNSLAEYQYHMVNQNHINIHTIPMQNYKPSMKSAFNHLQPQQQPTNIHTINQNIFQFPNQNKQNISLPNKNHLYKQTNIQNSMQFHQKSYLNSNHRLQKHTNNHQNQQFTKQSHVEQKQQSFKYVQAYYANKMAPYYREFDIDPQRQSTNKMPQYQNRKQLYTTSKNLIIQGNSSKFTRSESTSDLNKILQELGVRMIPVENGIVDFISLFTRENFQKIIQIKDTDLQQINTKLQESINELTMIYNNNINSPKSDLFMDSNIDFVIKAFVEFLKEILRQNELWMAYLMFNPIISSIIKFLKINKDNQEESLKLIDFPLLLTSIKIDSQTHCLQDFPIKVEADKISQFLIWFSQWFTMVQLAKSKWSIDFIEPLYNQVHYINNVYHDNVNRYKQCIIEKKVLHNKRQKRKIIEKQLKIKGKLQRQRQRQLEHLKKFGNKYDPRMYIIGDANIQKANVRKFHHQQNDKKIHHVNPYFNLSGQNYPINRLTEAQSDYFLSLKARQNQRNFTESSQVNDIFATKLRQRTDQEQRIRRNYRKLLQNQHMNSQINSDEQSLRDQMEDDELKQAYIAAFRSEYVSYFSPESEQDRKKQEDKWAVQALKLNNIIKNPNFYKNDIFSEITKQIQDVNKLTNIVRIDFRLYNCYQQYLMQLMSSNNKNNKLKSIYQGKNKFQSMYVNKEKQIFPQKNDPFIIQRNFRFRHNYYEYLTKNQFLPKYPGQSSQYEVKNKQENDKKNQNQQKMNQINNSQKLQTKLITSENKKGEQKQNQNQENIKQQSYEVQVSDGFLDQLI